MKIAIILVFLFLIDAMLINIIVGFYSLRLTWANVIGFLLLCLTIVFNLKVIDKLIENKRN